MNHARTPHGASVSSRIIRSIAALSTGEILGRLTAFVATALIARRLGPEGFGVVGFALAISGYFALVINGGLGQIGMREVARAPERAAALYSIVATTRLMLAGGAFLALVLVAVLLPTDPTTRAVTVLAGLSLFATAIEPAWVLKGLERPVLASAAQVFGQAVYAALAWLLVAGPDDVVRVPVVQFAGEFVAAVLVAMLIVKRERPAIAVAKGFALLKEAKYLTLARLLRLVVISADVVMLWFLAGDRDVGLYSAAYRVAFLLLAVASVVGVAYLPSFAREIRDEPEAIRRLMDDSLGLAALIGAPLVAGVLVTAEPVLVTLFGGEYAQGAFALQLLALSTGVVFLHWSQGSYFVVREQFRMQAAINGAAAALNILLNLILIPAYGIAGAAFATLLAELAVLVLGGIVMLRARVSPSFKPVVFPIVAATGMALTVWLVSDQVRLAGQVGVGVAVYGGLLLAGRRYLPRYAVPTAGEAA